VFPLARISLDILTRLIPLPGAQRLLGSWPASLIVDPAVASPAPASRARACPAAAFPVLASQVAAFQAPSPCVSPPHDVPPFFPPCHHGLRVLLCPPGHPRDRHRRPFSRASASSFFGLPVRIISPGRLHSLFHPSRLMAACGFALVEHGVGGTERATARARGGRAPPEISEKAPTNRRRQGSAGVRESARLEAGLMGGEREAEEVGSAGRAADAATVCARAATIWCGRRRP
jgi:hypothetical protein